MNIVYGHWVETELVEGFPKTKYLVCSVCDRYAKVLYPYDCVTRKDELKYCPYCGARMVIENARI